MLAPILVFTADEIWENLPADSDAAGVCSPRGVARSKRRRADEALRANWERLFEIRDDVLQALEEARVAKQIGSSLEARVEIAAAGESYDLLERYRDELRYLFIVSQVDVVRSDEGAAGVVVKVLPARQARNVNAAGTIQRASANRLVIRTFANGALLRWKRLRA